VNHTIGYSVRKVAAVIHTNGDVSGSVPNWQIPPMVGPDF
jgi:hypothetical protein